MRSRKQDGIPAKCYECGQCFKAPVSTAKVKGDSEVGKKALEQEVRLLKAKIRSYETANGASEVAELAGDKPTSDGSDTHKVAVKKLHRQIQDLKSMDPALRDTLCEAKGGFDAFQTQLENEVQDLLARQREQRPLSQQKASADAHLRKMQKAKDEANTLLCDLAEQTKQLAARVAEQQAALLAADANLQKAALEAKRVAEKATAELCGIGVDTADINGRVTAAASDFVPGTPMWKSVEDLVRFASNNEVRSALSAAGMAPGELSGLEAQVRTVQAAADAASAPLVGHRLPGTSEAVATIVEEGRRDHQASLVGVPRELLVGILADMDLDPVSDDESVAPSEAGEPNEAQRKRKAAKAASRVKRKRVADQIKQLSVVTKFGQ